MTFYLPIIALFAGYFLGSISFAVIIAKRHGVDILNAGSGNPGATNVRRVCGKKPGNCVFALDAAKGVISSGWPLAAAFFFPAVFGETPDAVLYAQVAGFAGAILGHCFSIFLKFRGGKGVAVTVGALAGAIPACLLFSAILWFLGFFLTRYVSVASLLAGASLPVTALSIWGVSDLRFFLCIGIAALVFFTHRANIVRLANGTENRFVKNGK